MREIPGIPYRFEQPSLLELALSHRSLGKLNNERLEFLGDSILNCVVSIALFESRQNSTEGELTRLRARVVRGDTLAKLAAGLKLGDYVRLGGGELKSGGFTRSSILADTLEAIFGAVYVDGGFAPCERVIRQVFGAFIEQLPDADELKDPKTRLQEWLQSRALPLPEYRLVSAEGPPHKKQFLVACDARAAGIRVTGSGRSRRKAEQAAAVAALDCIAGKPEP